MRTSHLAVFILAALALQNAGIAADTPDAPPLPTAKSKKTVARLSKEAIAKLVSDLDSSDYKVRQQATRKLSKAGASVVPALVEATKHDSLEVSVRAVQILTNLYSSDDDDAVSGAETALEQLRLSKSHSVASRANDVLRRHYLTVRRPRAVAAIKKFGGKVHYRASATTTTETADLNTPIQYILLGKDWKGGEDGLKYVKRLEALPQLYLIRGVPISEKAVAELERELPQVTIQYRGKAYLGIQGQAGRFGCLISRVVDGGAAQKAGIFPGDEIVVFGKKPVPEFETLIELIKKHGPGDKVEVVVRRGGGRMTLVVELSAWK